MIEITGPQICFESFYDKCTQNWFYYFLVVFVEGLLGSEQERVSLMDLLRKLQP